MDVIDPTYLTEPQGKLGMCYLRSTKNIACNVMEGGSTEKDFQDSTHLTEPQGKLKICQIIDEIRF